MVLTPAFSLLLWQNSVCIFLSTELATENNENKEWKGTSCVTDSLFRMYFLTSGLVVSSLLSLMFVNQTGNTTEADT